MVDAHPGSCEPGEKSGIASEKWWKFGTREGVGWGGHRIGGLGWSCEALTRTKEDLMAEDRLPPAELMQKAGGDDFLRSVAEAVVQLLIGPSEAETLWSTFLKSLVRRGLRGTKLVISDAHEGRKAAIRRVMGATWQRCRCIG